MDNDIKTKVNSKRNTTLSAVKSPEELFTFLMSTTTYESGKHHKLLSPRDFYKLRKGDCHDYTMFILHEFECLGYHPKARFVMEVNPMNSKGGMTHSFVYYNEDNKVKWMECSWGGHDGIHEFDSLEEIEKYIMKEHEKGFNNYGIGNKEKFPELLFTSFGKHKPGESIYDIVNNCFK